MTQPTRKAIALITLAFALTSCSKEGGEKGGEQGEAKKPGEKAAAASVGAVQVPKDGKKFDPAIKPEKLPSGAWYCDMGTVHYARMDEGNQTCPLCKMKLKKKP